MSEANHAHEDHTPSPFHALLGIIVAAIIGGFFLFAMNFLLKG